MVFCKLLNGLAAIYRIALDMPVHEADVHLAVMIVKVFIKDDGKARVFDVYDQSSRAIVVERLSAFRAGEYVFSNIIIYTLLPFVFIWECVIPVTYEH